MLFMMNIVGNFTAEQMWVSRGRGEREEACSECEGEKAQKRERTREREGDRAKARNKCRSMILV